MINLIVNFCKIDTSSLRKQIFRRLSMHLNLMTQHLHMQKPGSTWVTLCMGKGYLYFWLIKWLSFFSRELLLNLESKGWLFGLLALSPRAKCLWVAMGGPQLVCGRKGLIITRPLRWALSIFVLFPKATGLPINSSITHKASQHFLQEILCWHSKPLLGWKIG